MQAQRKFAQGQGPSSSAKDLPGSSASNSNSSKDVLVTEPIMSTPPPAKDFLTYVCFQRNPVFQSLNYLGKSQTTTTATSASTSTTLMASPVKSPVKKRTSLGEDDSGEDTEKPRSGRKTKHVEPKPYIPMTGLGTKLVMEDKEKVHEQSSTVNDPSRPEKQNQSITKRKPGRPPKGDSVVPSVAASPEAPTKSESEYETASENDSSDDKKKNNNKKKSKLALEIGKNESGKDSSMKEVSSSISKAITSPLRDEVSSPLTDTTERKEERITRHMAWRHSYNNTPIEPTVKRIKKTPVIVTPPPPPLAPIIKETPAEMANPKNAKKDKETEEEEDSEFSSDDDKPLMAANNKKKGNNKNHGNNKKNLVTASNSNNKKESESNDSAKKVQVTKKQKSTASAINKRKSSPVASSSSVPSTPPKKKISKAGSNNKKSAPSDSVTSSVEKSGQSKNNKKNNVVNKKNSIDKDESDEETVPDSPKRSESKVKRKYLSKELEKLTGDSSPIDFSENETSKTNARPSRKTKEAATIYMELIGHKLNLDNSEDEDARSMDSYPELPNVKKTQQLEEECRQNVGKVERRGRKKKAVSTEKPESDEKVDTGDQKEGPEKDKALNKSFSDSDEEPLATKLTKKPKKGSSPVKAAEKVPKVPFKSSPMPVNSVPTSIPQSPIPIVVEPPKRSPVKLADAEDILNFSMNSFKSPISNYENYSMAISTPENSKSALPRTPTTLQQSQPPPLNLSSKSPGWQQGNGHNDSTRLSPGEFLRPPNKAKPRVCDAPISPIVDDTSPQNIANLMMNPLPSKEESGKIFGIASVTLAQSSGPQDTKCTLGKCGSIHNPSLGPAVPTEALLGEAMSNKDRRKSKVNMTQEQIQKWLIDCAAIGEKEILPDDLADIDYNVTPKPSTTIVDSPMDEGSPSILMRKAEAPRPMPMQQAITQQQLPSPVVLRQPHQPITKARQLFEKFDEDKDAVASEVEQSVKQILQKLTFDEDIPAAPVNTTPTTNVKKEKTEKGSLSAKKKAGNVKEEQSPGQGASADPTTPTSGDRKPIYNRRTPVYNKVAVESPQPVKQTLTKQNSFGAFSPENDVYAFDREEDDTPMKAPFRRQSGKSGESPRTGRGRKTNSLSPQKHVTGETTSPHVSVALNSSSSVALQIPPPSAVKEEPQASASAKNTPKKGSPKSPQKAAVNLSGGVDNNDSDSEGQTIYIPLQNAGVSKSGKSGDGQLIQGVSVKLGTEGPDGCVIMKAKLVTKPATSLGSGAAITDAKTQELMKSIIAGKDGGKPVPVGTVQPRFKSNETSVPGGSKSSGQLMRCGSNSSLVSQKSSFNRKSFDTTPIQPSNNTAFPRIDDPAQMVEAPIFRPTEKEFQDPMEFIERIMPIAARFGLCRIIPPSSFKPECRVSDDMRFMAYNQYVHKMLHRWGPSAKELYAIRKYLATQSIQLNQPPLIGGMEVDLPRLYHTVQELGGLSEVIEKKKWAKVAEDMCIPKTAQDRVSKLDDIYCKYLLPYDTMSPAERQKLFDEVEADWAKREAKARRNATRKIEPSEDGEEEEGDRNSDEESSEDEENDEDEDNLMECIVKGRSMALSAFFRVARNTMTLWFKNTEPPPAEVESEFWRHVAVRDHHVCVHSGSIDSSGWGYGFPAPGGSKSKGSACAKHPWNLKVLTNNSGSVLRSLGPVMGVTVPTLHVGMLFSACCWYRDPHGLPWIEYLHTGGSKIWYGVPDEQSTNFRTALTSLVPTHCQNKTIWLPCDTAMVPPHILTEKGVSLCRTEQRPGEFVIIFPRAYTSSVATGYVVSESVYFATNNWLDMAHEDFKVRKGDEWKGGYVD